MTETTEKTIRKLTGAQRFILYDAVSTDFKGKDKVNRNMDHYSEHYTQVLGFPIAPSSITDILIHLGIDYGHVRETKAYKIADLQKQVSDLEDIVLAHGEKINDLEKFCLQVLNKGRVAQ